eukprot:TRINITY_DN33102_c0_g1_i1.p1 TRINITY_DN33102_c0_g1~~TRINITY_DN33102_c0_g1_i1.p1  ORF type:complete len:269 (+),score=22.59 TRINITY_DN33102_c0_g1_i1:40-807(+)
MTPQSIPDYDVEATELDSLVTGGAKALKMESWTSNPVADSRVARGPLGVLTLIGAFVALVPGLSYPALSLVVVLTPSAVIQDMRGEIDDMMKTEMGGLGGLFGGFADGMIDKLVHNDRLQKPLVLLSSTRSVVGSIKELWRTGHEFVACLITLFSVVIPVTKLIMVALEAFQVGPDVLGYIGRVLSKWSMADVFAVGVFIAMLAINGSSSGERLKFTATLEPGFYWFVCHTLLSCCSATLLDLKAINTLVKQHKV